MAEIRKNWFNWHYIMGCLFLLAVAAAIVLAFSQESLQNKNDSSSLIGNFFSGKKACKSEEREKPECTYVEGRIAAHTSMHKQELDSYLAKFNLKVEIQTYDGQAWIDIINFDQKVDLTDSIVDQVRTGPTSFTTRVLFNPDARESEVDKYIAKKSLINYRYDRHEQLNMFEVLVPVETEYSWQSLEAPNLSVYPIIVVEAGLH